MARLEELLERLEELLAHIDGLDEPVRSAVFELLDGIDELHRLALTELGEGLGEQERSRLVARHPAIGWLFEAYAVGVNERREAEEVVTQLEPFLASQGASVELLEVSGGVVRVRLSVSDPGCTSAEAGLRRSVEDAFRDGWPGFARLEVIEPPPAPRPGAVLQIRRRH